ARSNRACVACGSQRSVSAERGARMSVAPRARRTAARCDPRKPAPPVIRMRSRARSDIRAQTLTDLRSDGSGVGCAHMASGTIPIQKARETAFSRHERAERQARVAKIDAVADDRDKFRKKNAYYHEEIERLAKFFIPEGASVLEIGCST